MPSIVLTRDRVSATMLLMRSIRLLTLGCIWLSFLVADCRLRAEEPPIQKTPTNQDLAQAIGNANKLVVTEPLKSIALFTLSAPGIGSEFLQQAQIDEHAEWFHCMCYGDAWITFYSGDTKLAVISFHHARSLRWMGGPWASDALLSENFGATLAQWFATKGFPLFEDRRLADIAYANAEQKKQHDFSSQLPPSTREILLAPGAGFERESTFARRSLAAAPDRAQLAASIFRAFGQLPPKPSGYDYMMSVCRQIIESSDGADLARALELVAGDDRGLQGAAYLFSQTLFLSKLPATGATDWAPKLAEIVFRTFDDSAKPAAVRRLISIPGPAIDELLVAIASGQREFPYSAHLQRDKYDQEPNLVSAACLALAMRHNLAATALAKKMLPSTSDQPSRTALEVVLQFAESGRSVNPEIFKLQSFIIGRAGLQLMKEMPADAVSAKLLGAALDAPYGAIREEAEEMATGLGIPEFRKRDPHNFDEIKVDRSLAEDNPKEAIAAYSEDLLRAIGATKARLLRYRGCAYSNLGQLDAALRDLRASQEIEHNRDVQREIANVLWNSGDYGEAVKTLNHQFPLSDPWDLEARGLAYLAKEDFANAEKDLTVAVVVDPRELYRQLFQHLAAHLAGHPELSRLQALRKEALADDSEWTPKIADYLLGRCTEEALFAAATSSGGSTERAHEAEACYYASQVHRLHNDLAGEKLFLSRCVQLEQFRLTEHWLAVARLRNATK